MSDTEQSETTPPPKEAIGRAKWLHWWFCRVFSQISLDKTFLDKVISVIAIRELSPVLKTAEILDLEVHPGTPGGANYLIAVSFKLTKESDITREVIPVVMKTSVDDNGDYTLEVCRKGPIPSAVQFESVQSCAECQKITDPDKRTFCLLNCDSRRSNQSALHLGFFQSDFSGSPDTNLKLVQFNLIAPPATDTPAFSPGLPPVTIAEGIIAAHQEYLKMYQPESGSQNSTQVRILFVLPPEDNVDISVLGDVQTLLSNRGIYVERRTTTQLHDSSSLLPESSPRDNQTGPELRLIMPTSDGSGQAEISVVYFFAGASCSCTMRFTIEGTRAIKCPTINLLPTRFGTVQQALAQKVPPGPVLPDSLPVVSQGTVGNALISAWDGRSPNEQISNSVRGWMLFESVEGNVEVRAHSLINMSVS